MKKSLLMLAVLLLLSTMSAMAVEEMQSGYSFYVYPGETIRPNYPPLAHLIDPALTEDDFTITYTAGDHRLIHVAEDGTVTVDEGIETGRVYRTVQLNYKPINAKRGRAVMFTVGVDVKNPITQINTTFDSCVLAMDQNVTFGVRLNEGTVQIMDVKGYDKNIIDVTDEYQHQYDGNGEWVVRITPKAIGKTTIDLMFRGAKKSIEVEVVNPPTGVKMSSDEFSCFVGESLDVGTQVLGGSGYNTLDIKVQSGSTVYNKAYFFPDDDRTFISNTAGVHYITMTTHNGHVARAVVNVHDKKKCVRLGATSIINAGVDSTAIVAYDADGNIVSVPMEVTEGGEIAHFVNGVLKSTGAGKIVVTAYNPDGTTVSGTFEIVAQPTAIVLNKTKVQLNVGETFDLVVGFDQGAAEYTLDMMTSTNEPPFGLYPVKLEGLKICAMAPGTVSVEVQAGNLFAYCLVEVLDSEKAISIDLPDPFGVGKTWKLLVKDKTGKVYPATFYQQEEEAYAAAVVTESGLMTGKREGYSFIYAQLEDGRLLRFKQTVEKIPDWLSHPDVELKLNAADPQLGAPQSDVGRIDMGWIEIDIEDESIATATGNLQLHKEGTTKVTMTAVKGGAQCTFLLTVLPADDAIYIMADGKRYTSHYYSIDIPCDYSETLPDVTDYYGNKLSVTWKITDESLFPGNPNNTAFRLSGSSLKATWPSGNCNLTATTKDGRSIVMSAIAYRLPDKIKFREDSYTLKVGEHVQTEVEKDENMQSGDRVGDLTWKVGDTSIIRFDEWFPATGMPTVTGLKPGTTTLTATQPNGAKAVCTITVVESGRLPGDADDNGAVNVNDALTVFRYCAGKGNAINLSNADVTGDAQVSAQDALLILQQAAGWNVPLK